MFFLSPLSVWSFTDPGGVGGGGGGEATVYPYFYAS